MIDLRLVLALLLLVACGQPEADTEEHATGEAPHNVRVVEIVAGNLPEQLFLSGPVRAVQATDVATEEAGVVRTIGKDKGDVVKRGQILIQLDRDLLAAEMKSAEATATLREYNEDRTRTLFDEDSASKQEALIAYTELEQARQTAAIARLRYERAAIKAPFDGVVAARHVEVGQLVSPGTVVARVVNPFVLELRGWLTERQVGGVSEGASAVVSLDGYDQPIEGTVQFVGIEADPKNGKFPVEIRLPNEDLRVRAGVVGRARVVKAVHENILAVPRDALLLLPGEARVFVVRDDKAELRSVTLGVDQGLMVQITSGLEVGDRLVVRGQRDLNSGSPVIVQEVADQWDGSISTDPDVVRAHVPDPRDDRGSASPTPVSGTERGQR